MAQLSVLQMFNRLMRKTGQSEVTNSHLRGLSGLQLLSLDKLQEATTEFYGEAFWEFAEEEYSITMASGSARYSMSTRLRAVNKDTFVNRSGDKKMHFVTPGQFISANKDWREASAGQPGTIFPHKRKFQIFPKPNSTASGSMIDYFGWVNGSTIGTGTSSVAATFSRMMIDCQLAIIELAALKINTYRGNPESLVNFNNYYGFTEGGEKRPGLLDKCKQSYESDILDPEVVYQF